MPTDDIQSRMRALASRRVQLLTRVADEAKAVVPALLDHNLSNTARPLSEALFALEALDQEMLEFVQGNVEAVVQAMMDSLGKQR